MINNNEQFDFIFLGKGISSLLLALIFNKKNKKTLILTVPELEKETLVNDFILLPLHILRELSIPFEEMSYKSKNFLAYIERYHVKQNFFINYNKLLDNSEKKYSFTSSNNMGLINKDKFLNYLEKLYENGDKSKILSLKLSEIEVKDKEDKSKSVEINFYHDSNYFSLKSEKLILNDFIATFFNLDQYNENTEITNIYKYSFSINSVISDSIEYYYDFNNLFEYISVFPGNMKTVINYFSEKNDNPNVKTIIDSFLEKNFLDQYSEKDFSIEFVNKSKSFIQLSLKENNNPNIIVLPEKCISYFPINYSFSINVIYSIFELNSYLIDENFYIFYTRINKLLNDLSKLNLYFFNQFNKEDLNKIGQFFNNKNLSKIHDFSIIQRKLKLKITKKSNIELEKILSLLKNTINFNIESNT